MDTELSLAYRKSFHAWLQKNLAQHKQALYWSTMDRFCGYAPIYDYYPLQFAPAFGVQLDTRLEKINLASQLCFKAALLKDQYNDCKEKDADSQEQAASAKILLFKAKEILNSLFEGESKFWYYWENRYQELQEAEVVEKKFGEKKFSYVAYSCLADKKVAIAKLAIDCNFVSSGSTSTHLHQRLLESHAAFATSMQLFDDLFDVPQDLANDQFNIAVHFLKQQCSSLGVIFDAGKPEEMEKHLFLSGVAKSLMRLCLKEVSKAKLIANGIDAPLWQATLTSYEQMYRKIMEGTDEYLSLFKAKALLSKKFKFASVEVPTNIFDSCNSGLQFIQRQQNTDGTWFDYHTSAGVSNIWATGFILNMTSQLLPEHVSAKAKLALASEPGLLWGYRSRYIVDSDSSGFAILCGAGKGANGNRSLNQLVRRQNIDGGFATYAAEDISALGKLMHMPEGSDYSGWTQSHPCVSAVVLFTLLKFNRKKDIRTIQHLETFLINYIDSHRRLAYWWTSEVYTLFWLVQCCRYTISGDLKKKIIDFYNVVIDNFTKKREKGDPSDLHTPFYTSMLIKCCCELKKEYKKPESFAITETLVRSLLASQYEDGSWEGTAALQIPEPNCLDPESSLYPVSEHGCNVRAPEYNRLFSTAVAINALHQFGKDYE